MTRIFTPEQRLAMLDIALPMLPMPGGNYVSAKRRMGDVVNLAGALSTGSKGVMLGRSAQGVRRKTATPRR